MTITQAQLRNAGISHVTTMLAKACRETMKRVQALPETKDGSFHHALAYDVVLGFRACEIIDPAMGEQFKTDCRTWGVPVDEILAEDEARRASEQ